MSQTLAQDIDALVAHWFAVDADLETVLVATTPPQRGVPTVLFLQVTSSTPPSEDEVVLFGFAPSEDFPYPMALGQVRPDELEALKRGTLTMPWKWTLEGARRYERPAGRRSA